MPQLSRTTANAGSTARGSPPRSLSPPSTSWSADASPRNSRCSGRRDAVVEAGRPPAPADPNQSSRRHAARPVHHLVSGHGCQRQPSPSSRHGGLSISQALTCSRDQPPFVLSRVQFETRRFQFRSSPPLGDLGRLVLRVSNWTRFRYCAGRMLSKTFSGAVQKYRHARPVRSKPPALPPPAAVPPSPL